jgi:hypothetical protein
MAVPWLRADRTSGRPSHATTCSAPVPAATVRSLPAGLPVTDRGQAPPLLGCGPCVKPVAALLEVAGDALAVIDGVGVVVF